MSAIPIVALGNLPPITAQDAPSLLAQLNTTLRRLGTVNAILQPFVVSPPPVLVSNVLVPTQQWAQTWNLGGGPTLADSFTGGAGANIPNPPWVQEMNAIWHYVAGFWPSGSDGIGGLANNHNIARYNASGLATDQEAQIKLTSIGAGIPDWAGPMVRCQAGAASGYLFKGGTVSSKISKIVAGVETVLVAGGAAAANGDTLKLRATGTLLEGFINGVLALSVVDASFAAGDPGIYAYGIVIGMDDFFAQNAPGAGTAQTALLLQITDTNSPAASLLLDLQVNAVSKFKVRKDGLVTFSALTITPGPVIVGADPGDPASLLRVGGSISINQYVAYNGGGAGGGYIQIDVTPKLIISLNGTTRAQMTTAAFTPVVSSGMTLGTAVLPWGNAFLGGNLTVVGSSFLNGTTTVGLGAGGPNLIIDGGNNGLAQLSFLIGGLSRWLVRIDVLETGADTGSAWNLLARNDAGGIIDRPITIVRAAGGGMTLSRPLTLNAAAVISGDVTLGARLLFSTAASKLVPGGTSLSFRNNADTADNLIVTDAGVVTIRSTLAILGNAIGFTAAAGVFIATTDNNTITLTTNNLARWTFGTDGSLKAAANGTGITTKDATLLHTAVALTNGAAAAVGTLNNAPVAGNPTKWVPVDDNGTTRYAPLW